MTFVFEVRHQLFFRILTFDFPVRLLYTVLVLFLLLPWVRPRSDLIEDVRRLSARHGEGLRRLAHHECVQSGHSWLPLCLQSFVIGGQEVFP